MQVVLLKDVENLGNANDIVTVKNGYGRNYLIPRKLALIANKGNTARVKEMVKQAEAREAKLLEEFKGQVEKIKSATIKIGAKVGTSGKIFGSVTNIQLADALKNTAGVSVDRKKIEILSEEVKSLGTYQAMAELHPKVKVDFDFEVIAE